MSHWKVILAALVIFAAGVFAGGVGVRLLQKPQPPLRTSVEQPLLPVVVSEEFIRRMAGELDLSPEQRERLAKMLWGSQARIRELYSLVGPEVSEELHFVRESIRAELTPEQQKRFDEFVRKQRQRRWGDRPRPDGQGPRRQAAGPSEGGSRRPSRTGATGEVRRPSEPRSSERRPRPERGSTNAAQPPGPAAPEAAR